MQWTLMILALFGVAVDVAASFSGLAVYLLCKS